MKVKQKKKKPSVQYLEDASNIKYIPGAKLKRPLRIALCLYVKVGNIKGKSGDGTVGGDVILKLVYKHWYEYLLKNYKAKAIIVRPDRFILKTCKSVNDFNQINYLPL